MLTGIISWSLRHRLLVILATLALALVGGWSLSRLSIDAFPDTTPVQVQINSVAPALGPEDVERQITAMIEQALAGVPGLEQLRSISKFGLSQVIVTFEDGTDIYFARQLITERLNTVEIPEGIARPKLGPVTTGLGEVLHYVLSSKTRDLTELRSLHDWVIKPALRTVPGTAEINGWGGYEKQFQVLLDPVRLVKHGLSFGQVIEAIRDNNLTVGGGVLQHAGEMVLIRGVGRVTNLAEIRDIVITAREGVPIRIGDVADVAVGHEIRRGAVTADGQGEVVLGLGFMLMGQNSHDVTWRLKEQLEDIQKRLPSDVQLQAVYDRTELVDHVIDTVRQNLFEGGLLVIAALFMFLGNLRAGLIVACAIPLSMLFAFCGMVRFGIAGSLLSLGALDFGLVVDSSVVLIENVVRRMGHERADARSRLEIVRDAAVEVRKPTLFGELIIMIVYLPILTLTGVEGKLFRPMALTVIFALLGSLVLSMTLMPVLASLLLPRRLKEREPWLASLARWIYTPILDVALRHRYAVLGLAVGALLGGAVLARGLGSEFLPRLSEGALTLGVVRLAGTDLDESVRYNTQLERALLAAFPDEVEHVWTRIGTAEVATDPMGVEIGDQFIALKPRSQWKRAATQAELMELIQKEYRTFPGQKLSYSQPIEQRINEMTSGVRAELAVKLFGDDFAILTSKAYEIEAVLRTIRGCADPATEQITGQPTLQIQVRQDQLARYGIPAREVLALVEAIGGKPVGEVFEGPMHFPLAIRLPESLRATAEDLGALEVLTRQGERVPLSRLAKIEQLEGPATITREWGQRRITVQCNVRGRDLGSFVNEARRTIARRITLPSGRYHLEFGGQFEQLESAKRRLLIVVPIALALILTLLYLTYGRVLDAARIFIGVPFATVGGLVALWVREMPFSISAAVGFIALSGVSVLGDMVLVTTIRQLRHRGIATDLAVRQAAILRLRPVLMTALVAGLGFLPMAMSTGMGAEVQRPLATVVIGGVISSTFLTLIVLPVLYLTVGWRQAAERDPAGLA